MVVKKLVYLLSLVVGCNSRHAPTHGPSATPTHDVVTMGAVQTPTPLSQSTATEDVMPELSKVRMSRNVLIIGDSEACAVSPVAKEVAREYAVRTNSPVDDVIVECKGGTVVSYWAQGMHAQYVLNAHPKIDTLLVFLGTNHYRQKPLNADPKPILDLVTSRGLQCVWVGNVAIKGRKWPINAEMRALVTPTCSYFNAEEEPIQLCDGTHPDRANAKVLLGHVWETIPIKYEDTHD